MLIPRQKRSRHLIGPILRLNMLFNDGPGSIYSASAAAYGLLFDGPWGLPGADSMVQYGDNVLEHMLSEGASLVDVLEAGKVASAELWEKIPRQAEVDDAVGNSAGQVTG